MARRGENHLHRRYMTIRQGMYRRRFPTAYPPWLPPLSRRDVVSGGEIAYLFELPTARMKGVPVRRLTRPRIPAPPEAKRYERPTTIRRAAASRVVPSAGARGEPAPTNRARPHRRVARGACAVRPIGADGDDRLTRRCHTVCARGQERSTGSCQRAWAIAILAGIAAPEALACAVRRLDRRRVPRRRLERGVGGGRDHDVAGKARVLSPHGLRGLGGAAPGAWRDAEAWREWRAGRQAASRAPAPGQGDGFRSALREHISDPAQDGIAILQAENVAFDPDDRKYGVLAAGVQGSGQDRASCSGSSPTT